ncbi:MAG: SDR family oxidoreductase [Trueperaceae bacterium]|nr:SDR family oxidoreductase [Trueperaceae bacterium]
MSTPLHDDTLRGQVAIVTGAGRGLGRGGAVGLARRGATVIAVALEADELARTALLAPNGRIVEVALDLGESGAVDGLVDRVLADHGHVDVLINTAAMLPFETFQDTTPELWHRVLQVNLHACYQLAWRLYPAMVERGAGVISSVSSGAGVRPFILETAYVAGKYALEGLMKSLALEALPHGVAVTLTTPGAPSKPTGMTDAEFQALGDDARARYADELDVAEGFAWIAGQVDVALNGRRLDLHGLGALVRARGWGLTTHEALQRVERSS